MVRFCSGVVMSKRTPSISAASIGSSRMATSSPRWRIMGGYPTARCRSLPPAAISSSKRASMRATSGASLSEEVSRLAEEAAFLLRRLRRRRFGRGVLSRDHLLEVLGVLGDGKRGGERHPSGAHELRERLVEAEDAEAPAPLLQAGDLERLVVADEAPERNGARQKLRGHDHPLAVRRGQQPLTHDEVQPARAR